ncbi:MAG: histidine kinase dimerization/phospho-acceptor domain-containing protein [Clostridia bacterium]
MKKISEKFKSVRVKLFCTLSIIVIFIIALLIIMNSVVLETFYTMSKISAVKKEYNIINELYNTKDPAIFTQIKRDALANNFDILVEDENYMFIFSTNENFANAINQNSNIKNYFKIVDRNKQQILYSEDRMIIKKIVSNGLNCILLSGELDNGYKLYIQIPISAIEESVRISNNLLLIIGMIAIIIAGIAASYASKKFTNPILELNIIANKMSKLDFSQKYQLTDSDDEINELGNSINIMSEKLEKTIGQLRSSNLALERDIEEKSKIDEMRKQFISDVSHELKTPIALIQGYAEGLLENVNADDESRKYYAEVILDESNKMDKLVRQLLELMKLEYGKREFNNERFNICELIQEVIRKCNVMLEEKEIREVRFDMDKPVIIYADEFYIEQAFTNYFTNAIKHTKDVNGEKYIEIKIKENKNKNNVRVSVFNTGEILSDEDLERIWGRFYKVDESRNRADGGSGIGLALVKAIMNNYNSRYGAINKENGIEFYFEIQTTENKTNEKK